MSQVNALATDRRQRIDLLRGMLGASQQSAPLEEILRLLRREALDPGARFQASQGRIVVRSLDDLEHEVSRLDPDRTHFQRKAQILIDVLAIA